MPDADVIVVGAGAGGLAATWRLTTQGVRVTLLEAGRRYNPARDYPQTAGDFEHRPFPYDALDDEQGEPRYGYGPAQAVAAEFGAYRSWNRVRGALVPGNTRQYAQYAHVRGVGGSTLHFQGEAHRYHPDALRLRSLHGVGVDWPIPYAELERYYDLAEHIIGVAAPADNPFRPRGNAPPLLPPHPLSYASTRLAPAFATLGATLIPNALAILPTAYRGRPPCNYCNACASGCPLGDKGSADVTFLPAALATGRLDLRTHAQAVAVEIDAHGQAAAVVYRDAGGTHRRVAAPYIMLAGGAVETPRLLLLSTSARFPNGLANDARQVGEHLTESLFWLSVALLPDRVDSYRGVPIDGTAWDFAIPARLAEGGIGGFRLSTAHGAAGLRGPVAYAERLIPGFGAAHQRQLAADFGRAVALLALGDWLPNARTRIDLDPSLKDSAGIPLARITSHLGDNERHLLRRMADSTRAVWTAAGAEIVEETSALDLFSSAHVLGTCRMGDDPAQAVADADGFSHEVPNLAFADGAVVPSSGSGDAPMLTITALAVRTADRLLARSKSRPAP
ncbi:MAG: GMC family oxidoreductase [Candidatus Binatia bacterium]